MVKGHKVSVMKISSGNPHNIMPTANNILHSKIAERIDLILSVLTTKIIIK